MYKFIKSFKQLDAEFTKIKGPNAKVWCKSSVIRFERIGTPGAWTAIHVTSGGARSAVYLSITPDDKAHITKRWVPFCRWSQLLGLEAFTHRGRDYIVPGSVSIRRNETNRMLWPRFNSIMMYDLKSDVFIGPKFDIKYERVKDRYAQWTKEWSAFHSYLQALAAFDALPVPRTWVELDLAGKPIDKPEFVDFVDAVRRLDCEAAIRIVYYNQPRQPSNSEALRDEVLVYYKENKHEVQAAAGALVEVEVER